MDRELTTASMLAIFTAAAVLSLSLPSKAAMLPMIVCVTGMILCAAQLIFDLRRRASGQETEIPAPAVSPELDAFTQSKELDETEFQPDGRSIPEWEMFVWLGIFMLILLAIGFLAGGPLVVFLFVRFASREPMRTAIIAGVGSFAVLFLIFAWLLELSLFPGLIAEHFF